MSAADQSTKDKSMAAYLKAKGVTRTSRNCPLCHRGVAVGATPLLSHFAGACKPRRPHDGRTKTAVAAGPPPRGQRAPAAAVLNP